MCANTLEAAQHLVKTASTLTESQINQCNKGIFIGGLDKKGSLEEMGTWLHKKAASVIIPEIDDPSTSDFGIPFKSLLKPQNGMLYHSGEYILLDQ